MGRNIAAAAVGILAGGVTVGLVETASHKLVPLPKGFDPMHPDMSLLPLGAFLGVCVAWALGPLAAGMVSKLVARTPKLILPGLLGVFFLAMDIANLVMIPSPLWFSIWGVIVPIPCALLGWKAAEKLRPASGEHSEQAA